MIREEERGLRYLVPVVYDRDGNCLNFLKQGNLGTQPNVFNKTVRCPTGSCSANRPMLKTATPPDTPSAPASFD